MSMRLKSCSLLALAASGLLFSAAPASAQTIYSAGATLPFGLYRAWFDCFGQVLVGPRDASCTTAAGYPIETSALIAYAPVGSGGGITALTNRQSPSATPSDTPYENASVVYNEGTTGYGSGSEFHDFSGSDATLTDAQITAYNTAASAARGPVIQIPTVGSPVAIPYNQTGLTYAATRVVPAGTKTTTGGSGRLYLSRRAYCGIFTGQITNWNHPILREDNLNTDLVPAGSSKPIRLIVRSDSSGTTFLLTRHLEAVCDGSVDNSHPNNPGNIADWTGGVATARCNPPTVTTNCITWPAGALTAAGSNGVAGLVNTTNGGISYVSPDYTQQVATPEISPAPVAANLQNQADFNNDNIAPATARAPAPSNTQVSIAGFVLPSTNNAQHWSAALDGGTVSGGAQVIPTDSSNPIRNPAGATAYPIAGFTMLDFYSCYFPADEATNLKRFVQWFTNRSPVSDTSGAGVSSAIADSLARSAGFAPLTATIKTQVWNYTNSATIGLKTGPVSGTCSISSGT